MSSTGNTNPGNFANRPKEEVKAIASMGGKASHGGHATDESDAQRTDSVATEGRNPDGTFTKGSQAASEAGHKGGQHSHDNDESKKAEEDTTSGAHEGRNADGTFTKGSEAAAAAGHKGGQH